MRYRLRTLIAQFTIRDLLLLTVVAGILVAWRIDHTRLIQQPPPAIEDRYEVVMSGKDGEKAYLFNP
jgi:hypothetical protein